MSAAWTQTRAPLGAHYTDTGTIAKLINPLIVEPLAAEWAAIKPILEKAQCKGVKSAPYKAAVAAYQGYFQRLHSFRVLDPACGSGNFLYLSLHALKDLEHAAQIDLELLGFGRQMHVETGPANVLGLKINEYAAELVRVTVWIGDLQWSQRNGRPIAQNPILRSLDSIEHRDALIAEDGSESQWPAADVIIDRSHAQRGNAACDALRRRDAERPAMGSHAERGNHPTGQRRVKLDTEATA